MQEYVYGKFEDEIIDIFRSKTPNYDRAKELLSLGANLNAKSSKSYQDNMLAEILLGFWQTKCNDFWNERECEEDSCEDCNDCLSEDQVGEKMLSTIRFFLNNGFDLSEDNSKYGAQCLYALTLSTFDKYMLTAARILLDAGAKNVANYNGNGGDVLYAIGEEVSYQSLDQGEAMANLFVAYYQMVLAKEENRPYHGINLYEAAIGKIITKVLATPNENHSIFYCTDFPNSKHSNCYNGSLYFVYEDGHLATTEYTDLWVDNASLPPELVDVSEYFAGICGYTVMNIKFDYRRIIKNKTNHTQPIIMITMSSGKVLNLTINFGEVEEENRCAYFYITDADTDSVIQKL